MLKLVQRAHGTGDGKEAFISAAREVMLQGCVALTTMRHGKE